MDFTCRPLKDIIYIDPTGFDSDKDLEYWLQLCLDFNPVAKSSN